VRHETVLRDLSAAGAALLPVPGLTAASGPLGIEIPDLHLAVAARIIESGEGVLRLGFDIDAAMRTRIEDLVARLAAEADPAA
jgi:hypothetical protein